MLLIFKSWGSNMAPTTLGNTGKRCKILHILTFSKLHRKTQTKIVIITKTIGNYCNSLLFFYYKQAFFNHVFDSWFPPN